MESKQLILTANQQAQALVRPLLADLATAPLVAATPSGNHAHWVLGHLVTSEGGFRSMMEGGSNPMADLAPLFGGKSTPRADGAGYPPYNELLARLDALQEESLVHLRALSEEDLDRPSLGVPPGFEAFFGTWRGVLLTRAMHWMNHRGQLADCRRAAGREPLMA